MITMELIFGCMFAVLMSAGGIGGIIIAVTKWSSGIIADRLSKSYQLQLDKELEKYKHNLENRRYVTQTQYDIEFSIYRDLTKSLFTVVKSFSEIIDEFYIENMTEDELIKFEMEKGEETINRVLDFQNKIFENAPFIPVDLFERYENLSLIANNILKNRLANLNKLAKGDSNIKNIKDVTSEDDREKITNFIADYSKLNVEVRDYLNSMKLVE